MRVKVEDISDTEAAVSIELPEDRDARMLEALAVRTLVHCIDEEGYDHPREALEGSWHEFVMGILGGFYAAHKASDELAPLFRVLMAMVGAAREGYKSAEEYHIVDEEGEE